MSDQDVPAQLAHARKLVANGKLPDAIQINKRILERFPAHADALLQRSIFESIDDHYRTARRYARLASRSIPGGKREYLLLLSRLKTYNLVDEMLGLVERMPEALLRDVDVALHLAMLHRAIGQQEQALHYARLGEARHPGNPSLETAIAISLINLGDMDGAKQRLLECLERNPDHAPAWWQLSRLQKAPGDANYVDALRGAISRTTANKDTALLAYALHRELDGLDDIGESIRALELACFSMRKTITYSAAEDREMFAEIKALPFERPDRAPCTEAPFTPVFIVGMHRSGTTLLEQMLSGHDDVHAAGELYDFTSQLRYAADHHCNFELDRQIVQSSPDFDYRRIGEGYLASVGRNRTGQKFVTDKLPSNFLNIGFILKALPNARILHLVRNPLETCFSNLREPFSETACRYSYDQAELASYFREYEALILHWQSMFPDNILHVHYASLAGDPFSEMDKVAKFLGLDMQSSTFTTTGSSRSISTASAVQARQAPTLPETPKWFGYRDHLGPLIRILSPAGHKIGTGSTLQ